MLINEKRAYIYLNRTCNQNCIFCASDETNGQHSSFDDVGSIISFIEDITSQCDSIVISGGEPTLHPRLSDIISRAAKYFRNIQMMTNGLSFANKEYMQTIIAQGLTDVCIPIISPDPKINNKLVGRADGYQVQERGIRNLLAADKSIRPNIQIKTIVQNSVLESFDKFHDYFTSLPSLPDYFIINGLHIGKKVLLNPHIIPDFALAGKHVSKLIISLAELKMVVAVAEFPLCLLSIEALDVLARSGFPVSAVDVDTFIIDKGDINFRESCHVKASFCSEQCIAHNLCDGLPFKNNNIIKSKVLSLLKPIVID